MTPSPLRFSSDNREATFCVRRTSNILAHNEYEDDDEGRENVLFEGGSTEGSFPMNRFCNFSFSRQPLSPTNQFSSASQISESDQKCSIGVDDLPRSAKRTKISHHSGGNSDLLHERVVRTIAQTSQQTSSLSPADIKLMNSVVQYTRGYGKTVFPLAGAPPEKLMSKPARSIDLLKLNAPSHDSQFADAPESSSIPSPTATDCSKCTLQSPGLMPSITSSYENANDIASLNLGQEFQLPPTCHSGREDVRPCDCGMDLCREIGYPNLGSFEFPSSSPNLVSIWCQCLGINDLQRIQQIHGNPAQFRVAYWHFRPEYRAFSDRTGTWIPRNRILVPDACLQEFVDKIKDAKQLQHDRAPSMRMLDLHNYWIRVRRPPVLEP